MFRRLLALGLSLLCACADPRARSPLPPAGHGIFGAPPLQRLLVVTDRAGVPVYEQSLAQGGAVVLHHFAAQTSWKYVDDLTEEDVRDADAVVYMPTRSAMPAHGWQNLRFAKRLVAFDQHLAQLQTLGFFPNVSAAKEIAAPPGSKIEYDGQTFALPQRVYTRFDATGGRVLGSVEGKGKTPFAIVDGPAAFVAVPLDFSTTYLDPYGQGYLLAACDALRVALNSPAMPRVAMLRFEDVSVRTPSENMRAIAEYMASNGLPYGIGVIPEQLIKGEPVKSLAEDQPLVDALLFAQRNRARIILHGLHHSYNSPEDFEFWDDANNRPLPQDSEAWMRAKIDQGLATERALGLWPVMWETPHYSASPLDYRVISTYFAVSWERRMPVDFLPWPLQEDGYGSVLLPENLGYIALPGQGPEKIVKWYTLDMALARAKTFLVCEDCVPAGFLHPSTVDVSQVQQFVEGVENLGYRFVDPLELVALPKNRTYVR